MANSITGGRQIYADTPGVLWDAALEVNSILYTGGLVTGHKAVLVDNANRPIWIGTIDDELRDINSPQIGRVYGLRLQSIDSGSVIIYFS